MKVSLKTLIIGGPVGIAHALREAWLAGRMRRVSLYMDRERALHREHMAQLRAELDSLQASKTSAAARAASYWRALS